MKKNLLKILILMALASFLSPLYNSAMALPDLEVSSIRLIEGCRIEITITNIGTSGVPRAAYHKRRGVGVQMFKDGQPWGGLSLFGVDPSRRLRTPGASVSYVWFPGATNLMLYEGSHTIRVDVDNNRVLRESNEGNNSRTETLSCVNPRLPDLVVTELVATGSAIVVGRDKIELPIRVVVRNQGNAPASRFKVSIDYYGPTIGGPFGVAFTVPGQRNRWYPYIQYLREGGETTLRGKVTFASARARGATVFLQAFVDSCAGDEFMPDYCRIRESNEDNNASSPISVSLP